MRHAQCVECLFLWVAYVVSLLKELRGSEEFFKIEHSEMLFPAVLEPTQILRNDELNNYYHKANQHLDLTLIVPLLFQDLKNP